jgi:hypothetical protein
LKLVELIVRIRTRNDRKYGGIVIGFENLDQREYPGISPNE